MDQEYDNYEERREARRRRQMLRRRQEKRRKKMIRFYTMLAALAIAAILLIWGAVRLVGGILSGAESSGKDSSVETAETAETSQERMTETVTELAKLPSSVPETTAAEYRAERTSDTQAMNGEVHSNYGIFIELGTGKILAERNSDTMINPASMTKILTVLVAAEHLEDLDEKVAVSQEAVDYSFSNDCSNAGFEAGEKVTVRDLFYGTILPSGGEAAAALAIHTAGSLDDFIEMMNQKLAELGLSGTAHVTNCVGLYDADHRCTVYDMAMILEAALDNPLCREVLSAKTYTTSATTEHPDGLLLSNWFLRRIEDKDTGGHVISAKTGYVAEAGSCAASFGVDRMGSCYICVTADAESSWRCIYDHVALYKQFAK